MFRMSVKCLKAGLYAMLIMLILMSGISVAYADVCEESISYNQTKTFTIAPAGSLEVCYFPNGQGTVEMGVRVAWWEYWISQNSPTVTVNVFWGASSDATEWTWLASISTTTSWKYAPPLYLQQGVYVFSTSTSALAGVNMNVRPY